VAEGNGSFTNRRHNPRMQRGITHLASEISLLEASVERARLALGCSFSSSAEYEADLIRERRAAGAYGSSRSRRGIALGGIAAGLLLFAFLFG
jgi:hypothetical protein